MCRRPAKKVTPLTDGGVSAAATPAPAEPWYYLFWPPIRWGVIVAAALLAEAFWRDGKAERRRLRERQAAKKSGDEKGRG